MTSRERLRRCYFLEELDRPAVYSRTGFPLKDPSYQKLKSVLSEKTERKGIWWCRGVEQREGMQHRREPYSEDFERYVSVLHSPKGELTCSRLASLKGQPGLDESYLVKSREDAERYLSLPVPEIDGPVEEYFESDRAMAEGGIVEAFLSSNPAGRVAELCGSENFAMMSVTDRDIIHAMCQREMDITLGTVKYLVSKGIGPFFAMQGEEYIVPPLHGPKDFHDFNVQYDKPIIDLVHEAGGRIHIHCHGSVKAVFQGFLDMGADVLHPFEPPPMGNMDPGEAKALARGKMCLEGNIQISDMYESNPDDIRAQTEFLIEVGFDDNRGLIVSPTASPYIRGKGEACLENYLAMIDTVLGCKTPS